MARLKSWGVPFAPSGRVWPVGGGAPRALAYTLADGTVVGNAATAFHAPRPGRWHAAVDLPCAPGQPVRAVAAGTVKGSAIGFVRLGAVVIDHGSFACIYAEIDLQSMAKAGIKPGSKVTAGQTIGFGALNDSGRSMLHFETWTPSKVPAGFTPWIQDNPPPSGLLDPTSLLLPLVTSGSTTASSPSSSDKGKLIAVVGLGAIAWWAWGRR